MPKKVEFKQKLPKTILGKVLRPALRDEELNKNGIGGKRDGDHVEIKPVIDKTVRLGIK